METYKTYLICSIDRATTAGFCCASRSRHKMKNFKLMEHTQPPFQSSICHLGRKDIRVAMFAFIFDIVMALSLL